MFSIILTKAKAFELSICSKAFNIRDILKTTNYSNK